MIPTIYAGILLLLICIIPMTRRKLVWTWRLFALAQVFGATSVATLAALGGSSLLVPQAGAIVLMITAFLVLAPRDGATTGQAMRTHIFAIILIAYTVVLTIFGPRIFAGQIDLVAIKLDIVDGRIVALPLEPKPSNFAHAGYFICSFVTAIAVTLIFRRKLDAGEFRLGVLAAGVILASSALVEGVAQMAHVDDIFSFLRNANYAMVNQIILGVHRLSGFWPEPSAFAAAALPYAVFSSEEWLDRRSWGTGLIALFIWTMLLASTSSTGIVGMAAYLALFVPRLLLGRSTVLRVAAILSIAGVSLVFLGIYLFAPDSFDAMWQFVASLTVDKADSESAEQRSGWAMQGWAAFKASYGLGLGAGTFRSSSLVLALIGTLGVIGAVLVLLYCLQLAGVAVLRTQRTASTQRSAAWAALMALVPLIISGATADPGLIFAMFAGFALTVQRAGAPSPSAQMLTPVYE
jgi:hypothetical protein